MSEWAVPRMWPGETCAVLASGTSMNQVTADAVRESGIRTIAVCRTWELAPWASMIYAADALWWNAYRKQMGHISALKVACEPTAFLDVNSLKAGALDGYSDDPKVVCTGGNSGYQAICVAALAGCKRILLCGFDMHGKHWHPEYKHPLRVHGKEIFDRWLPRFETLRMALWMRNIEVINCTPGSALKTWPYVLLAEALAMERVTTA